MAKIMVSIRDETFAAWSFEALERGITIQELLRAVIVPEWMRFTNVAATRRENGQLHSVTVVGKDTKLPHLLNR